MARPDLEDSTTNRDQWNAAVNWNNLAGDWWDSTATAQGSSAWRSVNIADTDTARSITFDVTTLFQSIFDNPNHTSAVLVRAAGGRVDFASLADATVANRPKISYDGGADQTCLDCVSISAGSFGGSTASPLPVTTADGERLLIEFPAPGTRPTSATMTLYTTAQFEAVASVGITANVFWLRYPTESAPSLSTIPSAPATVTAGSITPTSAAATWTDVTGETSYDVQYAPSPYTAWTTLSGSPTAANVVTLNTGDVLTDGTSYKFRVRATNAAGSSAYTESGIFTTTTLTRLRPNADTSTSGWTATPSGTLYTTVDEVTADDADYVQAATTGTVKFKLQSSTDPGSDLYHKVKVRARKASGTLTLQLVQGHPTETLIASTTVAATAAFAEHTLALTTPEAAAITNYGDLYVKLIAS